MQGTVENKTQKKKKKNIIESFICTDVRQLLESLLLQSERRPDKRILKTYALFHFQSNEYKA